jgi:hypothetical protein
MMKTLLITAAIFAPCAAYAAGPVTSNFCHGKTKLEFVSIGVMVMTTADGWKDAYLDSGSVGTGMPNRIYMANHDEETMVGVLFAEDGSSVMLSSGDVHTTYTRCPD